MPRPVSWFPRLPALLRSVQSSVRSHYSARELQDLFEVQPRSAQMLIQLLPSIRIGRTLLVERSSLIEFLRRLNQAEDAAKELDRIRKAPRPAAVRRKLRSLVRKDDDVSSLPENVEIETGRLTIRFQDMEELAQSLWKLAQIMEEDLEGFAAHYEPADVLVSQQDPESELEVQDALWITQWLKEHE